MSLVNMKTLLKDAADNNYGVGAFSVSNMEMIMGVIKAAEEKKSPAIIQVTQARLPYSPLYLIGPMMMAAAKNASVPIAVHLDHGMELEGIQEALDLGFTSVMIDASKLSLKDNIDMVNQVIRMAVPYHAAVEAEIGTIGGSEGWAKNDDIQCSDPKEVLELYEKSKVDAIAISIGNAHGVYIAEPKLEFGILEESSKIVPVPLVLHGGSGISDEDFRKCIKRGIRKVNIATASYMAAEKSVINSVTSGGKHDFFTLSTGMMQAVFENVSYHMDVFMSSGKAQ